MKNWINTTALNTTALVSLLSTAAPLWAQASAPMPAPPAAPAPAAAAAPLAEAEVRRIDLANARLQLRHGPIPQLDMPPMTMVFRVRDVSLLEGLKEGDRILFTAEKINGQYVVMTVQPTASPR